MREEDDPLISNEPNPESKKHTSAARADDLTHGNLWVRLWFLLENSVLSSQGEDWVNSMDQQGVYRIAVMG